LATGARDGGAALWGAGAELLRVLDGPREPVERLVYSPDGSYLAAAFRSGLVAVWNAESPGAPRLLAAGPGRVRGIAFSRDSTYIAAAGTDGVSIWEMATGDPVGRYGVPKEVRAIAFQPNGALLATAELDGVVRLREPLSGSV